MSNKNKQTAGQAAQGAPAAATPTTPGAAPTPAGETSDQAQAADEAAEHEADDQDDEPDADDQDDEETVQLRQLVRQLQADKQDLQQQLTAERQRSGEAAGELNEAQLLIDELQKRLERADARQASSDSVVVSHGEVDYKVLAPKFQFEGKVYQADDLKADAALVARLVAAEVGFLHPITPGA